MSDDNDYMMDDLPPSSGQRSNKRIEPKADLRLDAGLPANIDAEKTILGAILLDSDTAFIEADEKLDAEDFSLDSHQRIYSRIAELVASKRAVDIVTLANELARYKESEAVGGVAYLASLTEGLPLRPVIEDYIRIVKDKALLRKLMAISSAAIARASDQSETALEVGLAMSGQIQAALVSGIQTTIERAGDFFKREFPTADSWHERSARIQGLETGFVEFDKLTCGLQRGELIILAARPSIGKTAFMWNIAEHIGINCEGIVAIESLEMNKESFLRRGICSRARIPSQDQRSGALAEKALNEHTRMMRENFESAYNEIERSQIFINDESRSSKAIATEMRALKKRAGALDLVMIDYLGLFQHSEARRGSRWNQAIEVGLDVLEMKYLAKELDAPVVLLCQLSREVTKRTDKRPILSDLRDSGNIEEHADMVAFLHREGYYEPKDEKLKHKAEVIIAKQRNGPIDTVELHWEGTYSRFSDPIDPRDLQGDFNNW